MVVPRNLGIVAQALVHGDVLRSPSIHHSASLCAPEPWRIAHRAGCIVLLVTLLAIGASEQALAASGSISASPNPCTVTTPGGTCTLTLSWSTSGVTAAHVWVTDANNVQQDIFTGTSGSQSLNWIQALPQHYTFQLYNYSTGSKGAVLASVSVSVPAPVAHTGSISASPNPCTVTTPGGTCTLTLSWSTSGVSAAHVWVTDANNVQQDIFTGTSGSQSLNWIQALPQHYTFQLYDYSGGSKGAVLASVNVSVPAPVAHTGSISASPNPCTVTTPGGTCTLTLSWSTSGVSAAHVWVTDTNNVQQDLFTGTSGSQSLNWIQALPQHYTFQLYDYSSGSKGSVLASVNVSVPAPVAHTGSISASPNPCTVTSPGGTCTLTLSWSTSGVSAAHVWVTDANNVQQDLFTGTSGSQSLNWIQALPQQYTFQLYDYSSGSKGAVLASVNVSVPAPTAHTGTISATPNPCTVTTPGGTCTLTLSWSTSGVSAAHVWATDANNVQQDIFTGTSGSQSLNWIQALPQQYTFQLYDYSSGSKGSVLASVNVSVPAPVAHTGSISASPNPCTVTTPGGTCTLTLSWSTSGVSAAHVWVTDANNVQQDIFTGTSGSQSLNWIQALPQHYTFQLYDYSSGSKGVVLASVNVSVPAPTSHTGTISASPNPCTVTTPGGTCTLTLGWSTSGVTAAHVWVTDANNVQQDLFTGTSGSQSLNWIQALPQRYTFQLYDYSSGSKGAVLASVDVSVPAPPSHTGTITASPNPCTVTTPGGTCTLTLSWSTSGVSAAHVWVTDANNVQQDISTGTSGSQSLNWIQALPQHYTFQLYDYSSGSKGSVLASVDVSVPAPTSHTGTISASPNPCTVTAPGGSCTLTLSWSTSGVSAAHVWVTDANNVQQDIFTGTSGSQSLNWIQALPQHYTFQLYDYSSGSKGAVLASVDVSVPAPTSHIGTISASPNPCTVTTPGGTCTLTLSWSTSGVTAAHVWVTDANNVQQDLFTGTSGSQSLNWIQALPQHYTFQLYDYSSGSKGAVLTSVDVSVPAPTSHTGTISASPNPCTVTTPGGTCTLTLSWSTSGATAAHVWVTDANNVQQDLFTGTSGSQSLNWIQALPQHYTFQLYDYSSGSKGSVLASVDVSVPAPTSHTGTISASPNPCTVTTPGGTCTLTLSWSTSGATGAHVWVTDANNVQQDIFTGTSGSQSLNWIQALPQHYTFQLYDYSSGSKGAVLASVNVSVPAPTGTASGTISASPNPCTVTTPGGTCTLALTWSSSGVTAAHVWVTDANNVQQDLFTGTSGSQSLNWIQALPQHYTFQLYDYSSGSKGAVLASVNVSVPASTAHAGTISASPNPCTVTTPGGTCTLTLSWSTSGVSTAHVWVTDANNVQQDLFTGTSGSQSLNWIQALPQHYTFQLYDYSSGSKGTLLASVPVSVPAPGSASGTISASPNPCTVTTPGGTCTLTLTWSAAGAKAAQVWVVDANNVQQQLFNTLSGSQSLNWIQALPQHYTFQLWDYSSGGRGALLASTSVSVTAPAAGTVTGTISASPNPCNVATPGGTCTLNLSWSTTGAKAAQVWVVDANNVQQQLFSTLSGSQSLNWIQALPQHYIFQLWDYSTGARGALLSSVNVSVPSTTGTASGTLKGNPSTCQVTVAGGTCTIALVWTTQNVAAAQISVTDVNGVEKPVTSGLNGTSTLTWIQALPQKYVFHLWDYSSGSRGAELANLPVSASGPNSTSGKPAINVDPPRGNAGDSFRVYGSGLAPGQVQVWLVPSTGQPTSLGSTPAGSDGGFSLTYTTPASITGGSYGVYAVDAAGTRTVSAYFNVSAPNPATTNGSNNGQNGTNGDPINTATGNYVYQHTDLQLPGRGLPLAFVRSYNSQDGSPGPLGAGWTHSYQSSLTQDANGNVTIRMPDGQIVMFNLVGGAYVSQYNGVYSSLQSTTPGSLVLTTKSQMKYTFGSGQLAAIADRNGNTIQLAYSGANLTTITDTVGRQLTLVYDGSGHLISLTDPLNRKLQYSYDGAGNLLTYTDARGGQFTYNYDASHHMLSAGDPNHVTFLTNTYDSSGRVTSQNDGMGNHWTYSYDANTLITTITDPNGKVSYHQHDSNFQLLRATDTLGKSDQYQYDALGNRISVQDRNGRTTGYSYDTNGNVIAMMDAQSHVQAAAFNSQNNPLSRTDALGNSFTYAYDGNGNLITSTDPLGNKTTYSYNNYGQLISKTDPLGRTSRYGYDSIGSLLQVTDPLGNVTTYAYDASGRRISSTDAKGFATATAYDANDNVVSVADPLGNKTQYVYDGNNNRTKLTDPRGKSTSYSYDGNNKLVVTTDAIGNNVTNTYDQLRNLVSATDPRGNTTVSTYDSENRLIAVKDPLGNITSYTYDSAGNRIATTDPLGNVTLYAYDSLNRLAAVTDALGNSTTTARDAAGRAVTTTDAAGNTTTFMYDGLGRQAWIQDPAGGRVAFQYDNAGNRTQITDSLGKVTQFSYDGLNRLSITTDALGNTTTNQYDTVGNLSQVTDGNGNSKSYQYDGDHRPTKVTYSTGGAIQFVYDASGNRVQMTDLVGTSTYIYDDLNRLQSYTSPAGASLGFIFDAVSNRTAIKYPGSHSVQYAYDSDNRISKVTDWNAFSASYAYDADGRIIGVSYSNGLSSKYSYDSIGQNLSIQHGSGGSIYSEATTWSPNGNPVSSDISGLNGTGLASENTAYTYNDASQLTSSTYGQSVSDRNGNLIMQPVFGGVTMVTYDVNNRATRISGPSTNASINASMKYFGDGKLAELDAMGSSHIYLEDPTASGNRILAEMDGAGNLQVGYVYGPRGMLSQISGSQTYLYLHNLQGSTVKVVDSAGSVQNSYRYDPFGQRLPSSTEQVTNAFAFLGAFSVPSIGQYSLMTYRAYDSKQGRFYGLDPLRFSAGTILSPYLYGRQSPFRFLDPSGLCSLSAVFDYNSDCYSFADSQVLVDTIHGIPKAAVTVGACAGGLQQACDTISKSGFSKLEVGAIQAEGLIVTSYFGGPEAAKIVQGVSWTSKGVKGLVEVVPGIFNGTLTVPQALGILKDFGLDLAGDQLDDVLGLVAGKLSDLGFGGLVTAGIDQKLLTPGNHK